MRPSFNPFSCIENLPTEESGLCIERGYAVCLVQSATIARSSSDSHRRVYAGPVYPVGHKGRFLEVLNELDTRPDQKVAEIGARYPALTANYLCTCSPAIRFAEIRHYENREGRKCSEKKMTVVLPQLYFVGCLSTYELQMRRLDRASYKKNHLENRASEAKEVLKKNMSHALIYAGVDIMGALKCEGFGKLPLVTDPYGRPHVCEAGDGLLSVRSGEVVWRLNNYVDMSVPQKRKFAADQTYVLNTRTSYRSVRTLEMPFALAGKTSWPCRIIPDKKLVTECSRP